MSNYIIDVQLMTLIACRDTYSLQSWSWRANQTRSLLYMHVIQFRRISTIFHDWMIIGIDNYMLGYF